MSSPARPSLGKVVFTEGPHSLYKQQGMVPDLVAVDANKSNFFTYIHPLATSTIRVTIFYLPPATNCSFTTIIISMSLTRVSSLSAPWCVRQRAAARRAWQTALLGLAPAARRSAMHTYNMSVSASKWLTCHKHNLGRMVELGIKEINELLCVYKTIYFAQYILA